MFINFNIPKLAKTYFICILIGLILGIAGTITVQNIHPNKSTESTVTVVYGNIRRQNELVAASQSYSITDKAGDTNKLFDIIEIPFTDNSFWYRYVGEIKVGVNLKTAEFSNSGNTITVTLDQPYVISNTPNTEKSTVLEEHNNIFNPIHVEDTEKFFKECQERSLQEVGAEELFESARENAEQNITSMFKAALGDSCECNFVWREQ